MVSSGAEEWRDQNLLLRELFESGEYKVNVIEVCNKPSTGACHMFFLPQWE